MHGLIRSRRAPRNAFTVLKPCRWVLSPRLWKWRTGLNHIELYTLFECSPPWHILWQFIWDKFWHSIWHLISHVFWHSIWIPSVNRDGMSYKNLALTWQGVNPKNLFKAAPEGSLSESLLWPLQPWHGTNMNKIYSRRFATATARTASLGSRS